MSLADPPGLVAKPESVASSERDELLRLASVIAHQLRSPLSAVQTVLGSLLGGFAGPLDPRQRWLVEKAWERCGSGLGLVRNLLRLRSLGQLDEADLGPVNMVAAISGAVDAVRDAAGERGVELELQVDVPDVDGAWVRGESALIGEILGVLLDNAVKYTPQGGHVTARLTLVEGAPQEGAAPTVCAEVVDNGIGIPAEGYERLFHEFYRSPAAKNIVAEGTGLGLAFAWRAARRLGGEVVVEPSASGGVRAMASFPQRSEYSRGVVSPVRAPFTEETRTVSQRVLVIGGVTAGSKAAARIMRLDPDADVTIVERGRFLAYSGCGLPYYISGEVTEQRTLLETPLGSVRDSAFFHQLKNVRTYDLTEAIRIDRARRVVRLRRLIDGREHDQPYDRLIIATGARPVIPDVPGSDLGGVYTLQGIEDAEAIRSRLQAPRTKDVVIVGAGLLGCQIAEAAMMRGARLTLIEARPAILDIVDEEIAALVQRILEAHGVRVITGNPVVAFEGEGRVWAVRLADGTALSCDFVVLAMGLLPEVDLARDAGLAIGPTGAIAVDRTLRTSDPVVFAAGDCAEQVDLVTGRPTWLSGAAPASMQGRVAAANVCGGHEEYSGVLGTTILKVFDGTVARTGLTEAEARHAGFTPVVALLPGPDRAHFVRNARSVVLKLVVDGATGRLLGGQGVGLGEVAKRIDVLATALQAGMNVHQLASLNLAYAPAYSMAVDNLIIAANVVRNKLDGRFVGISPLELWELMRGDSPPLLLDVRQPEEYGRIRLAGSRHIQLANLRSRLRDLPRDRQIVTVCSLGLRSYEASLILKSHGFDDVRVLDGGLEAWPFAAERLV
jgi:NADPH-dependent 2,4-dienoyl-CoA reductase/sulfur reductase-like enzyme/rhodanese-related sulfurtransferase